MNAVTLDASGQPVALARSGIVLRTPGIEGSAELGAAPSAGFRTSNARSTSAVRAAVSMAQGRVTQEVVLDARVAPTSVAGRSVSVGGKVALSAPTPAEDEVQVLLVEHESGVFEWVFSAPSPTPGTRTYELGVEARAASATPGTRGVVGAVVRRVLRVIVLRAIRAAGAAAGRRYLHGWEDEHRAYGLRPFQVGSYTTDSRPDPAPSAPVAAAPTLLFVHGTFSRSHLAFGALPADALAALGAAYQGRVLAFDHPSLSRHPRENAEELVRRLKPSAGLELDVIAHSRGGLVARELADVLTGSGARVRRIVFVATPNAGTVLADPERAGALLDVMTTAISLAPDNVITESLAAVIELVREAASGVVEGLPGLQAMRVDGGYLANLNQRADTSGHATYAMSADFDGSSRGIRAWLSDRVADHLFTGDANDLVVPTKGVYARAGTGFAEVADREILDGRLGVSHTTFFEHERTVRALKKWLAVP